MNIFFELQGSKAYCWTQKADAFFIGYLEVDGTTLYGPAALEWFEKHCPGLAVTNFPKPGGIFSFVKKKAGQLHIITDSINFFPLYFYFEGGHLIVSDSFLWCAGQVPHLQLNTAAVPEFETGGFILGNETFADKIYRTNASRIYHFTHNKIECEAYFNYFNKNNFAFPADQLFAEASKKLDETFRQTLHFLNGRTAVVPLSGGYDSRLIVAALTKAKQEKIICFTYGKMNAEVTLSESVARQFQLPWYFIDYEQIDIDKYLAEPQFFQYLEFAAGGASMPYLSEYFAVRELQERKLIPEDSVFLPGHSGDFLGGSYVLKTVKTQHHFPQFIPQLERVYFNFRRKSFTEKKLLRERIQRHFHPVLPKEASYQTAIEYWDFNEKLVKFISNSSRVFPFLGYEVYFPFWNIDLAEFFFRVPYQYREGKKLYNTVLEKNYFEPMKVAFAQKELKTSALSISKQKIKDAIRYFFPWKTVLKRINRHDWMHYEKLARPMLTDLERTNGKAFTHFKNYNAVITAWYIRRMAQKFAEK